MIQVEVVIGANRTTEEGTTLQMLRIEVNVVELIGGV